MAAPAGGGWKNAANHRLAAMGWDHGYYSQAPYTANFYRELAPSWLDFAALVKGQRPPRPREGAPFTYLELGCGMGYGLCLLASLYPEGQFTGVDFQPDHIAHAHWLAAELELSNICFVEADFLALQHDPAPLGSGFAYVAAHGIATWVSEPVQQALLAVAAAALAPGGLFYCSYNTYPGWLALTAYQQLVQLERQRSDPAAGLEPFRRAGATLSALLGDPADPLPLGAALPELGPRLQGLDSQDSHYLTGEYANAGWQPLYVAELHRRASAHKLSYRATATLPELIDTLLPAPLRTTVQAEANPDLRQTLVDLATNKSFRRDLFSKGRLELTRLQREGLLAALEVRLQEAPPQETYVFPTGFGEVTGPPQLYGALEQALADGPLNLAELASELEQPPEDTVQAVALLLHAGRLGLERGGAGDQAAAACRRVNGRLRELILEGCPFRMLAAPAIGSAVVLNPIEAMLSQGLEQGLEGELLALCVQTGLTGLGAELRDRQQQPITDPVAQLQGLQEAADQFSTRRLPFWRALGVVADLAGPGAPLSPADPAGGISP